MSQRRSILVSRLRLWNSILYQSILPLHKSSTYLFLTLITHLHTLYAFFSIKTRTLRITASAGTYIRQSKMRHLCVILSYIAQNPLLLPLNESPPCFSGNVAIRLCIFGKAHPYRAFYLIQFQLMALRAAHSRILLTCTG